MKPTAATHPREPGLRLADAARLFFRHASPRLLVGFAVYAVAYRLWVGGFTVWDFALVSLQVALQPMTEWLVHVLVLGELSESVALTRRTLMNLRRGLYASA